MLVEIVVGRQTREALVPRAAAFVRQIDKLPLPVKSAPGFLVNRILAPYLMAAMRAVDEGIAPEAVDEAALAFGMPMGPIELADTVGLDICVEVGKLLGDAAAPPRRLMELVGAGHLGRKTGRGFYAWVGGQAAEAGAPAPSRPGSRNGWWRRTSPKPSPRWRSTSSPTATWSTPARSSGPASRRSGAGRCITPARPDRTAGSVRRPGNAQLVYDFSLDASPHARARATRSTFRGRRPAGPRRADRRARRPA